jgi:hypothetical protein
MWRGRRQQAFFVCLSWAALMAGVALSQTAFAAQEREKAEVPSWSLVKGQGTRDQGPRTKDQTAFTYQGQLKDASGPVSGAYDFQFILYSAQTGGEKLGSIDIEDLALTNGLFSVRLDFGRAVLEAKEGWLEIGVRPTGSGESYTVLFPRQKLTPTPYAIFAQHEQWSLIGVPVGFAGDRNKHTDTLSIDEKQVPLADVDASLAKPAEKAITSTTPDDGTVTAAANPAACTPVMSGAMAITCDSRDPDPAFSATNTNSMGTGIVGKGGVTGAYFQATGSSGTRVGAYGIGGSAGLLGESTTTEPNNSGVHGRNFAPAPGGWGVFGFSQNGFAGVFGSGGQNGVFGLVNGAGSGVYGSNEGGGLGVLGTSKGGDGISGRSFAPNKSGVFGFSDTGSNGVTGVSNSTGVGVLGTSARNDGVSGQSFAPDKSGVFGFSDTGSNGVTGISNSTGTGVFGFSINGQGMVGVSRAAGKSGVFGESQDPNGFGGIFRNIRGGVALLVDGVASTKVLQITGGGDLAEPFPITNTEAIRPGLVVAIDPDQPGHLRIADQAYDRTVAGIISGANGINPGLTMKQEGTAADGAHPVALTGRVYCWADASHGAIEPGDLLTTSNTPGHAMKVSDHAKAQGAIIGKAMTSLTQGRGLVLVLVTLQ